MAKSGKKTIYIGVAWPYANGEQHIGHVAGAYLPPDIFARYQRMQGNDVLMVSGSDSHGTPITVRADEEGVKPKDILDRYHAKFIESYQKIGFTFDLFTHTETQNHFDTVHSFFKDHLAKGYLYTEKQKQLFDRSAGKFLPDRYVEGICPHCGFDGARGDQCDNCGKTYEPIELKMPRSKMTGSTDLEVRETEHFFFDLGKTNDMLTEWLATGKDHWRSQVINWSRARVASKDLRGRAITRDMTWGVPIPVPGYDGKCIYVWYEAVMGYLSAAKEWAKVIGEPEAWRRYWDPKVNPDVRSYYFIGKDNVEFHSIMWPAILLATGGLHLPYDVPANEYLNSYGRKFSKSRGNAVSVLSVLERYQPDAWRYALTALAPETADVNFTWDDFLEKVNSELVAAWGNLVNRVLGFAYKRYEGKIPKPGVITDAGQSLLAEVKAGFQTVGDLYDKVKLRAALEESRRLTQRVNQYLSETTPWSLAKTDPEGAATIIFVALQCIDWLKVMWAPILPFSSQKVHETMGYKGQLFGRQYTETRKDDSRGDHLVLRYDHTEAVGTWQPSTLVPGQALLEPQALYIKLDDKAVLAEGGEG